jgi:uncharacterized protein YdeI (YjbR/CyaY-like superfamily)
VNSKVDAYIDRSTKWPNEMKRLRAVLLGCGLSESIKWGKPCYSSDDHLIAIMQEMKGFLALMFFKGALFADPHGVLQSQGPNSHSAKRVEFTSVGEVDALGDVIVEYVGRAIEAETLGVQPAPRGELILVEELQQRLQADGALRVAFEALTPGRQREYNIHFAGAKQSATRVGRIEKLAPKILAGKGMRE